MSSRAAADTRTRGIVRVAADVAFARGAVLPPNGVLPNLYIVASSADVDDCADVAIRFDSDRSFHAAVHWCYGLPLVVDPRDFYPDPFASSQQQMVEHQAACAALENGYVPMLLPDYPAFVNPWGIGLSLIAREGT